MTMLFHDALKSLPGITIFTFTEPQLAFADFKINNSVYFLVVSDLRMPVLNGMDLLKKCRNFFKLLSLDVSAVANKNF
jgi:two-component system, cell cycle response regulator CpdR